MTTDKLYAPGTVALRYADLLGWSLLPGHWLVDGESCSCKRPECEQPGAHPLVEPWEGFASNDGDQLREWWELYPQASVLLVPRGFVGLMVPARWGATTMGLRKTEGGFAPTPTVDGRGWFTFLVSPPETVSLRDGVAEVFMPLVRVSQRYRGVDALLSDDSLYIAVPPTCKGTRLQYVWLSAPFGVNDEGLPCGKPMQSATTVVRGLVEAAVMTYEGIMGDEERKERVRGLMEG